MRGGYLSGKTWEWQSSCPAIARLGRSYFVFVGEITTYYVNFACLDSDGPIIAPRRHGDKTNPLCVLPLASSVSAIPIPTEEINKIMF